MITSEHRPPFTACVDCKEQHICPIIASGAKSTLRVPKPHECIIKQIPKDGLANLANQLDNLIGLNRVEYEKLGRQLEFVLNKLEDRENHVIRG